ncbi:MAG: lactonase family protein [Pirellulales bacterium]
MTHGNAEWRSCRWIGLVGLLMSAMFFAGLASADDEAGKLRVYIGTYASAKSRGVYRAELDLATGQLSTPVLAGEVVNPSFVAIHPSKKFLYTVTEMIDSQGKKQGAVGAFAIDVATGDLKPLNKQASGGAGPCHVVVDRAGKNVLVANYGGGSVASLPIESDGSLAVAKSVVQHTGSSVDKSRQSAPHAHSINLDAGNRFAFAADLGLDKVLVYKFDPAAGTLSANDPPAGLVDPGSGPRHFAFHPNGKFAYVINEMALTVTAFAYDADRGTLTALQTISTVPEGAERKGASTAEVQVHPSGRFLYGSNRGHNTIAVFQIDETTGKLTAAGHQGSGVKTPRNFGVDPTGRYAIVANQDGDSLVVFKIDAATGALKPTGQPVEVGKPVCVKFVAP